MSAQKTTAAKKPATRKRKSPPGGLTALGGLTPAEALEIYRQVFLSRRIDDKQILLKKMGKAHFQINGAGHELVGIVGARHLRRAHDWFILYYRDRGMATGLGFTAEEQLLDAVGAPTDLSSGGRQMPNHWTRAEWNVLSPSSCTGTQYLHAVGAAEGGRLIRELGIDERAAEDEIVYVSSGEGTTSQGEFWEALNTAVRDADDRPFVSLPFLVLMKLESGRLQDLADISRMLGCADEASVDEVRTIIAQYRPQDMDDLESMHHLGKLEHES